MLVFFYGTDGYRMREETLSERERFLREHPNVEDRMVDAEDVERPVATLAEAVSGGGLFARSTVVRVRGLFSIDKARRDDVEAFFAKSFQSDPEVLVVVEEVRPDKRSRLFKTLVKISDRTEEFLPLESAALRRWAQEYIRNTFPDVAFEPRAVEEVLLRVGDDLSRVVNELEKLALGAEGGGRVTLENVRDSVAVSANSAVFDLLDALSTGDTRRALDVAREQYEQGSDAFAILGMLGYHARSSASALSLMEERGICDARSIAREAKLHPFAVEKILRNRSRVDLARAKRMLALLSRLDIAAKTGNIDSEFAVEEAILRS